MTTKAFWIDAIERAVKTFAQVLLSVLFIDQVIWAIDWRQGLGLAATATVASLLSSIASEPVSSRGTASIAPTAHPAPGEVRADAD